MKGVFDKMEQFDIRKSSGAGVSCVKAVPEHPAGIVIAIHGFTSSKESPTCRRLLERLPTADFGAVCMDLPGHGTGESAKESLRIPGALDSIEAVEAYVLREYPGCRIFYFASSFGAYLNGLFISTREHAGRKAFWRSAAVNMPDLFHKENPTEKEKQQLKDLQTKGFFDTDMDLHRPVRVTMDMYNDLLNNDLFEKFDAGRFGNHQIAMAHGKEDDVIDPKAAEAFSEKFGIPVTWFRGEGHSLSNAPSTPDRVIDLDISQYK